MPKPSLKPSDSILESQLIETMIAGLHRWRSDLQYPESHSDLQACVRAIMVMYKIERRALPEPLHPLCDVCSGTGYLTHIDDQGTVCRTTCKVEGCKYGTRIDISAW